MSKEASKQASKQANKQASKQAFLIYKLQIEIVKQHRQKTPDIIFSIKIFREIFINCLSENFSQQTAAPIHNTGNHSAMQIN